MNIKDIINGISDWATNFIKKLLPSSKAFLTTASAIVNAVKEVDAKQPYLFDFIVSIIPGEFDDRLLAKMRKGIPSILVGMGYVEKVENALEEGIAKIQSLEPEYKATALAALWIHIANILTDNGVSLKDLQKLQQTFYEVVGSKVVVNGGDTGPGTYPNCKPGAYRDDTTKTCKWDIG